MSLPHQIPSHSSSPSKSSLRRTSGPQSPATRTLLPSPHFENDPSLPLHQSPRLQELEIEHSIAEDTGKDVTAPFQPLFTLIEDSITNEHYHPTVHYIFADDDTDIITEAACRSLEQNDLFQAIESQAIASQGQSSAARYEESRLPLPNPGVHEHYLVLDVQPSSTPLGGPTSSTAAPTAFEVAAAQSFSSDWQVLRTSITNAPTIGDGPDDEGLMLRIEGRGNTPPDAATPKDKESMEEMIERFQKRLGEIRRIMEASEQAATATPAAGGNDMA